MAVKKSNEQKSTFTKVMELLHKGLVIELGGQDCDNVTVKIRIRRDDE